MIKNNTFRCKQRLGMVWKVRFKRRHGLNTIVNSLNAVYYGITVFL